MKRNIENSKNFGCGTLLLAIGTTTIDRRATYEMISKAKGDAGLHEVTQLFGEMYTNLPKDVIDDKDKVSQMRVAVMNKYNGDEEQLTKAAADKVADMFEKRLEAQNNPNRQTLINYALAQGAAIKATLDIPRLVVCAVPIIREIVMKVETRKYGAPQSSVSPELINSVVKLVS
jgi:hypothetical protein